MKTTLFVVLSAFAGVAAGQTLTINLADVKPGEVKTVPISPGIYTLQVINRIPFTIYSYTSLLTTKTIDPLDASPFSPQQTGTQSAPIGEEAETSEPTECADLQTATNSLTGETDEAKVPDLRVALKKASDKAATATCVDSNIKPKAALALADIDRTLADLFPVKAGQVLQVSISRNGDDGKPRTWTVSFDTGSRGEWRISYGFTFIPKQGEEFYSKAGSDPQKFTITQKADSGGLDFAPSIFFTWLPADGTFVFGRWTEDLAVGPTAGLGFDLSAPTVFAGLSFMYNENIALVGGAVLHQIEHLSGEFTPNQVIGENLASDKLVEKRYGVGGFVGLTFRFGSKPQGFGPTQQPAAATGSAGTTSQDKKPSDNKQAKPKDNVKAGEEPTQDGVKAAPADEPVDSKAKTESSPTGKATVAREGLRVLPIAVAAPPIQYRIIESSPPSAARFLDKRNRLLFKALTEANLERTQFVILTKSTWNPGDTVTVAFLGGTPALRQRIVNATRAWTDHANIRLDFGTGPPTGRYREWFKTDKDYKAQIRIAFLHGPTGGYWSCVGRDAIDPQVAGPGAPSMNLEGFDTSLPGDWEAVVLHEFGHALGFEHEHQHPNLACDFRWDDDDRYQRTRDAHGRFIPDSAGRRPGIYTVLGGPPNNWERPKVDFNLRQLSADDSHAFSTSAFDKASIMKYFFPAWMFRDGNDSKCFSYGENMTLSSLDVEGAARSYPASPAAAARLMLEKGSALDKLSHTTVLPADIRRELSRHSETLRSQALQVPQ